MFGSRVETRSSYLVACIAGGVAQNKVLAAGGAARSLRYCQLRKLVIWVRFDPVLAWALCCVLTFCRRIGTSQGWKFQTRSWYLWVFFSKFPKSTFFVKLDLPLSKLLAELSDLLRLGQCKPKEGNNDFLLLLLLGTRISHRKIPKLENEEEIRG